MASGSISKPKRAAELDDPPARLASVEEDPVGHRLVAEQDVLGDGQDWDQHEVLVDHVDPAGDRVGRTADRDRAAVEQDLALVRRGQPVQDVHQGGLAGAVLAEQGVDLAGPDLEADAVVGDDARIALGDAAHLERRARRLDQSRQSFGPRSGNAGKDAERAGRQDGRPVWISYARR